MIILKHLTIERFRLLRALNLHFPQRGSILIQGPNEAGKSALIESIYFALYGEPLVSKRGRRSLDDLIFYGATTANVTLTVAIGATELDISRTLERGHGQSISLVVRVPGQPDEDPITDVQQANARIVSALNHINGETLLNSGLIAQKDLNRLESISGTDRERSVRNLLGLETFAQLSDQFQVRPEDEASLAEWAERLQLAETQARIPEISKQLEQIEAALDAVRINEYLADIDQQESEIIELEQTLDEIHSTRLELKSRQARVQHLKKADATLTEIISAYEDIAEARRELPTLELDITNLERREREELPKIEKRVNELAELTRSFGTLQRMSNDLLSAVDTIKELEQDVKLHHELNQDIKALDEQIEQSRGRLQNVQQSWSDLEEKRRSMRPQLEERLQRLNFLLDRLKELREVEERYTRRLSGQSQADETAKQLLKVQRELEDTEQEQELVEQEARQVQKQAEELEANWRQISIRRQLEEWQRLKGLAQGLAQAEQHLNQARQHQEQLTRAAMDAKSAAARFMMFMLLCGIGIIVCLAIAGVLGGSVPAIAVIALILMLALFGVGASSFISYQKARTQEQEVKQNEQEAISRVGMMVAARETALRMGGNFDALYRVENEIRSLGGSIPQSVEEAQAILQRSQQQGDLGEAQQRMKEKLDAANAARNQVNVTLEAIAALRKERTRLEELRKQEQWDNLEELLQQDQASMELLHQELTLLAGQEGLPMASINARLQESPIASNDTFSSGALPPLDFVEDTTGLPTLENLIETTIKATEREMAALDGNADIASNLAAQTKSHQDATEALLERKRSLEERNARYQKSKPELQLERAREQQVALRSALQSLQDSLRQRVKPLGVSFGQAAIGNAEAQSRKQLEELHITLGNKVMSQERHSHYSELLKERQESLSELYKQLAKFSNTLGSWIVPLNPFAEALVGLRTRCQKELEEANEQGILKEIETLQSRVAASKVKIQLCQQEIATAKEEINGILAQRKRPQPKTYHRIDLSTIWPLLNEHKPADRERLEDEQAQLEQELAELEQRELTLSEKLATDKATLDLVQTRQQKEQYERAYLTKKHGNRMIAAVTERLLAKTQPRTKYYMQQILPLLTGGRYNDVLLETDTEQGGSFQVQVWDASAGEYLPTSALSGGAADQISLALRLAFTIATLPSELHSAPGFVILDEPLSSFDRGRAQALADVVTGEVLGKHFEQILLVSHSSAFDPALFPYHLYMDNGIIIESNLPIVPVPATMVLGSEPVTPLPEELPDAIYEDIDDVFDVDDDGDVTVSVPAIQLKKP